MEIVEARFSRAPDRKAFPQIHPAPGSEESPSAVQVTCGVHSRSPCGSAEDAVRRFIRSGEQERGNLTRRTQAGVGFEGPRFRVFHFGKDEMATISTA